jgi:hypothetical protein
MEISDTYRLDVPADREQRYERIIEHGRWSGAVPECKTLTLLAHRIKG